MRVKSHAKSIGSLKMTIRKVLNFNGSLGLTIPQEICRTLDLHWKEYVEVYFVNPDKIVIKKHVVAKEKGTILDGN